MIISEARLGMDEEANAFEEKHKRCERSTLTGPQLRIPLPTPAVSSLVALNLQEASGNDIR